MFKRITLALTWAAAFAATSLGAASIANAHPGWDGRHVDYYYGPSDAYYYGDYVPYRTYYRSYYGPRFNYYEPYYSGDYYYYDRPGVYFRGPRGRVAYRVGW